MAGKSRHTKGVVLAGIEHSGSTTSQWYFQESEFLESMAYGAEGRYGYPNFPSDRAVGGDFQLNSFKFISPAINVGKIWRGGALNQYYTGNVYPGRSWLGNVGGNLATIDSGLASTAYNRMKPTKPDFSGLNAIYELREVPGQFRQRFLQNGLHAISDYWIALQFGWKPLLSDIRNFVLTQIKAQERLQQLLRDNGRPVRRKVILYDKILSESRGTVFKYQALEPGFVTQYYPKQGIVETYTKDFDRAWASARFRYWLPDGPRDVNWKRAMMARIFGLYPAPSVVWNALPWTWLVDWFLNVGQMLENMEAGVANRCAADYFYMMRSRGGEQLNSCTGYYQRESGEVFSVQGTSFAQWAHKTRGVGDPFGWATAENTLSGMQLSILGALGMSRLRR